MRLTCHVIRLAVSLCACLAAGAAAAEMRIALLIGNQDYPSEVGTLSRPHDDVRVLKAALEEVDFEVITELDVDGPGLEDALDAFESRINAAAEQDDEVVAFFYFSGHGASTVDEGKRRNFLIPARAKVTTASQLIRRGEPLDLIIRSLAASRASTVFVVSDACRNEMTPGFDRGDKGFAPVVSRPGMFIASATYPGETAPDDGVFADALARSIRLPGHYAERAFSLAFRDVASTRSDYRLPTVSAALRKDFCFNGCPGAPVASTRTSADDSSGPDPREVVLFNQAVQLESKALMENFLATYPDTTLRLAAEEWIRRWSGSGSAQAWSPTIADFRAAQTELKRLELYDSAIDGVWGSGSSSALERFQRQNNLSPANGALSKEALAALKAAPTPQAVTLIERLTRELSDIGPEAVQAAGADDGGTRLVSLGYDYATGGDGKAQSDAIAARLYQAACDRGHSMGCGNLGLNYKYGNGVGQNDETAVALFTKGCELGYSGGCNNLGRMYEDGRGVAKDMGRAVDLYEQACEGRDQYACRNLGICYHYGQGVDVDLKEAEKYYREALKIDPNYEKAKEQLTALGVEP